MLSADTAPCNAHFTDRFQPLEAVPFAMQLPVHHTAIVCPVPDVDTGLRSRTASLTANFTLALLSCEIHAEALA